MEWFVPNTPKHLHVIHLFIKPEELVAMMERQGLVHKEVTGIGPRFNGGFIRSMLACRVLPGFGFHLTNHTLLGYLGELQKK